MRLFSYGTLQLPQVQLETFGRLLKGKPASLPGYCIGTVELLDTAVVEVSGERFHPILERSTDSVQPVAGPVFELTPEELIAANSYEVDAYQRVEAVLTDGSVCWIYTAAD